MEIKLSFYDGNLTNINLLGTNSPFPNYLCPLTMSFYYTLTDDKQKFLGKLN